jgi:hypothetical protein
MMEYTDIFSAVISDEIAPTLLALGFDQKKPARSPLSVDFARGGLSVCVAQGQVGDSLDVYISRSDDDAVLSSSEIASAQGREFIPSMAYDEKTLRTAAVALATFLKEASPLLCGDALFDRVVASAKEQARQYTRRLSDAGRANSAQFAFDEGNFAKVIDVLTPHVGSLSTHEQRLLLLARRKNRVGLSQRPRG